MVAEPSFGERVADVEQDVEAISVRVLGRRDAVLGEAPAGGEGLGEFRVQLAKPAGVDADGPERALDIAALEALGDEPDLRCVADALDTVEEGIPEGFLPRRNQLLQRVGGHVSPAR